MWHVLGKSAASLGQGCSKSGVYKLVASLGQSASADSRIGADVGAAEEQRINDRRSQAKQIPQGTACADPWLMGNFVARHKLSLDALAVDAIAVRRHPLSESFTILVIEK